MTQPTGNLYIDRMADDNELCTPVLNQRQIDYLLNHVDGLVKHWGFSNSSKPKLILDIEQLQILDYAKLPSLSPEQIDYIRKNLDDVRADPQDLIFFGLNSLISFVWELPKSADDARVAAAHEKALNLVITHMTEVIDYNFWTNDTLLPYWMRLSYLRVLSQIPPEALVKFKLDNVACIPVKSSVFNASSRVYQNNYYITFNYALEPILKMMNRFLMHFFITRENYAGPKRIQRALNEIAPIIFHFLRKIPANTLFSYSIIYEVESATAIQWLTCDQVDFIFKHEVGHLFHQHPQQLAEIDTRTNALQLRHEIEYEADAFAASMLRKKADPEQRTSVADTPATKETSAIEDYIGEFSAAQLLFIYMSFIDKSGDQMRKRLSGICTFIPATHSHPAPIDRLEKLRQMVPKEMMTPNPLIDFAQQFFDDILSYSDDLTDAELITCMKPFL